MPITLRARAPRTEPTSKPPRRRLAPNVICLFPEDREPVVRARRYGRYPQGVVALWRWPRIRPGVICELCNGANPANHGKLARIVERDGYRWECRAINEDFVLCDSDGKPTGQRGSVCLTDSENLRRVWDR